MFSDYHTELSAILRTLQWQARLVASCGEKDYLTRRERDIVYALVMKEIDSLIEPTDNPVSPGDLIESAGEARVPPFLEPRDEDFWLIRPVRAK
nr:MAG: hypothetical protein [Sanya fiers-like virus 32]